MKLIITRHGQTVENVKRIIQGHLPGKLTRKGVEQAKHLAKRLSKEKIDFIYSSDLTRAADTAKIIAKYHPKIPIIFVKELREKNLGVLQGTKDRKTDVFYSFSPARKLRDKVKNGESWLEVHKRVEKFFHKVFHKHKKDTVLFVSHGGVGGFLVGILMGKKPEEILKLEDMKNTAVTIFNISENKKHRLLVYNCTKHLPKHLKKK